MSDNLNITDIVGLATAGDLKGAILRLTLRGAAAGTGIVDFNDACVALATCDNPPLTEAEARDLISYRKSLETPVSVAGAMFDQFGKVRVGQTEATISATCGILEQTIGSNPGQTLIDRLANHVADYTTSQASTTSLKDNPPRNTKTGEIINITGDTRMFRGLALGSSHSAADKTVERIRKLHAASKAATATLDALRLKVKELTPATEATPA